MSDGSMNPSSSANFHEDLLVLGINSVFHSNQKDLKHEVIRYVSEIILPRLQKLDVDIQSRIVESALIENPSIFLEDMAWNQYVMNSILAMESLNLDNFYSQSGLYILLNRIKDLQQEVDWFNIFLRLGEVSTHAGSKCQGFATVLNWLVESDPENLRKILYRTESKSYPFQIKEELYSMAISYGIFDNKIARRVRSDTSGSLSSYILARLFENRSIYSDDVFQDLVTQFSDTKHKWVARYIALNMPMHLIPFLMGIKDDLALKILEKRMEVAEDQN